MSKLLLDFEVSSAANSGLLRIESWAVIHAELIWIMVAFLAALLLMLTFFILKNRRYRRKKDREMSAMVRQFIDERNKSEAILTDLDIGVIAYSSDGVKINSNPAAHKMLYPDHEPETLKELLGRYGQDNGLQAGLLLGNKTVTGTVQLGDRILRIRLKESMIDEKRKAGTIVILQDITEQEREEKQRKEFVANVSHELKTPLTTIKTYTESLLEWGLDEKNIEAVRKDIWRIHDDSIRMERLVEDLLLLSSIDSRGIRVRMEFLDFVRLVRQVVDRMQHQAQEKSIDMVCFTLTHIPLVFADRTALERVMTNLIGNAIKYTDKGGSVKVYIGYLVDDAYVKVADTGFGIEKENIPHIFDRFYRVDMTGSRMFGGTGLGLSIARELVELHNGKISVSSVLGKGTEFTAMIPIARKVLQDTMSACLLDYPLADPLHQAAADELMEAAKELKLDKKNLSELTKDQVERILDHLLEWEFQEDAPDVIQKINNVSDGDYVQANPSAKQTDSTAT